MNSILNPSIEQNFILTNHAQTRASQRGITFDMIQLTIRFGKLIMKQGLRYYVMTKNHLEKFDLKTRDRVRNMVVIVSSDHAVITCYKNEKALRHIKQKQKRLAKYSKNKKRYLN
jgi:hypothetical protein